MDGTRDERALEAVLQVRYAVRLAPGLLSRLLEDLDASYLLDNERFEEARMAALRVYREAPCRPMTLDAAGFPSDGEEAAARLQATLDALPPLPAEPGAEPIRGLVSPHIDYERGGPVYAEVWRASAEAARRAELVILFGTDHYGSDGTLTLTRQSYTTPWGMLPTETKLVDALAEAMGTEAAFAEELHHRREHSIELVAVWLHFIRGGRKVPVVPILCGSFGGFIAGSGDPATHEPFSAALDLLREAAAECRTLVVAAADLAHMGPAFGDAYGLDLVGRAQLRRADERLLEAVYAGSAQAFYDQLRAERDRRHVCGLPPIYLTLRLLGGTSGGAAGYALCPADPQGLSFVSIAGVTLH
jgi:AmmeMemoRadiSam system protein B